jgi:hypothetical protein
VKGDLTVDQLGWELLPISDGDAWDGLTRFYRPLWELAGRPRSGGHAAWIKRFSARTEE